MPEPMRLAQRRIRFGWSPAQETVPVDHVPVVSWHNPFFISHPTNIAVFAQPSVREYQSIRLIGAQLLDDLGEIVDMAGASRTVEPELHQLPVVQGELVQFRRIVTIVFSGIRVAR